MKISLTYFKSVGNTVTAKMVAVTTIVALTSVSAHSHSVHHEHHQTQHSHVNKQENRPKTHQQKGVSSSDIDTLIRQYSLTGNDHLIEEGWKLWRTIPTQTATTLLQGAWLAQAEHRFTYARELISKSLALTSHNTQAWLLEASIASIQGDDDAARYACKQLASSASPLISLTCNARLAKTPEEQQKAYKVLIKLLGLPMKNNIKHWVYSTTADIAWLQGDMVMAEKLYQESVKIHPSVQNRSAYSDILLDQKQYDKVLSLIPSDEQTPALGLRRLMAKKGLGQNIDENIHKLDQLFKQWIEQRDYKHAREMALFYLDIANDIKLAYKLAQQNFAIQKEVEDLYLLERSSKKMKLTQS